ncbi:hypothetical protein [Streptomyces nojiriensis]|uniref:hypothetical protein n=1 Tax=Streptomyces nojiriensis TaxID=66374 RepID=UPI00367BC28C
MSFRTRKVRGRNPLSGWDTSALARVDSRPHLEGGCNGDCQERLRTGCSQPRGAVGRGQARQPSHVAGDRPGRRRETGQEIAVYPAQLPVVAVGEGPQESTQRGQSAYAGEGPAHRAVPQPVGIVDGVGPAHRAQQRHQIRLVEERGDMHSSIGRSHLGRALSIART